MNPEKNLTSLEFELPEGDNCLSNPKEKFKTIFEIICSEKAKIPVFDNSTKFNSSSCTNNIKLYSREACPDFSFYGFFNEIISNKYIFGPLLILLGIFLCFFGYKFYNVLCLIAGVLLVSFVVLFLILSNFNIQYSTVEFWILILVVLIVGLIVGFIFLKYELHFVIDMIIAGFAGFLLGLFLYNFFFNQINFSPKVVYFSCIVFSIILLEFLILMFRKFMIIFCTSYNGAYAMVRGASFMIGGFPSEKEIMDLIEKKEWGQLKLVIFFTFFIYFFN